MELVGNKEKSLIRLFRQLTEPEQQRVRDFVESLKKTGERLLKDQPAQPDPVDQWMGIFEGRCTTSVEYAKRKEEEKRLER